MKIIHAWIYDPSAPSLFKPDRNARAKLFTLRCDRTAECDVYQKCNSCLLTAALKPCKLGKKSSRSGYTRQARKYHSTISEWRKEFADHLKSLKPLSAYNRVFSIGEFWYLPYSHMTKGVWGRGMPLSSEWVPKEEMNADLMERILTARPRAEFGGEIIGYQAEQIPKFLADMSANYPELWELVSREQKARLEDIDYKGRKAFLATLLPGNVDGWEWDGSRLKGSGNSFLPVKGKVEIEPIEGAVVKITDNSVVGPETQFAD